LGKRRTATIERPRRTGATRAPFLALAAASLLAVSRGLLASEPATPPPGTFAASVAVGMAEPGSFLDFVFAVDRWTSPEEGRALAALQAERGTDAVFARLAAAPVGKVRLSLSSPDRLPGGWSRQFGSGEIYAASVLPSPLGGRTVRFLTRMRFVLRDGAGRYGDQPGLVQLELDANGSGLGGTLIPANVVPLDAEGRLAFDPTPFPKDTFELVGVGAFDIRREPTPSPALDPRGERR
jgi:hypothetical protein